MYEQNTFNNLQDKIQLCRNKIAFETVLLDNSVSICDKMIAYLPKFINRLVRSDEWIIGKRL